MAVLYITEYLRVGSGDNSGGIQAGLEPPLADQTVNISGASTQSSALNNETRVVMVHTDLLCHVQIGENPTATTSTRRLPADTTVFYSIPPGVTFKIAVIQG